MDILITGGNGLLGHHLVPPLLDRGERVRVLALPGEDTAWLEASGAVVHRGDIRDPRSLAAPMSGADAVLHLAGMMGVWRPLSDYVAANVAGTENVCRAALAEGVERVVHVSSWTVYGMDRRVASAEDAPFAPFPEPYALTKTAGDRLVQKMIADEGLPAVIVRPGTFFGPGDRLHFERIAGRLAAGKGVVIGRGDNALPFVEVTDVVHGLLLALDAGSAVGQAYNITNDHPLTQWEFLAATAEEIGASPPRLHIPYPAAFAAGYSAEKLFNAIGVRRQPPVTRLGVKLFGTDNRHAIGKAFWQLGFSPQVDLRDGIRRAAAWYLSREPAAV